MHITHRYTVTQIPVNNLVLRRFCIAKSDLDIIMRSEQSCSMYGRRNAGAGSGYEDIFAVKSAPLALISVSVAPANYNITSGAAFCERLSFC